MFPPKIVLCCKMILVVLCCKVHSAEEKITEISIKNNSDFARKNEFAVAGIPFTRGTLKNANQLQLNDLRGNNLKIQTRQLAYWDDGSVKWALLSMIDSLKAGEVRKYQLCKGGASPMEAAVKISLNRNRNTLMVSGKKLRFSVNLTKFRLFESLELARGGKWQQALNPSQRALYLDSIFKELPPTGAGNLVKKLNIKADEFQSQSQVSYKVEEAGPIYTTLRFEGWFSGPKGKQGKFIVRLRVFDDLEQIEIKHTFIYTGEPRKNHFSGLGLCFNLPTKVEKIFYNGKSYSTSDGAFALRQLDADTYEINGSKTPQRSYGSVTLQTEQTTMGVAVRNFWQRFPKGISIKNNTLDVELWGKTGLMADLRNTTKMGEPGIGKDEVFDTKAQGTARTHDVLLFFGEKISPQEAQNKGIAWNKPLRPSASNVYNCATLVEGKIMPPDLKKFPKTEYFAKLAFNWLQAAQKKFKWYGWFDYGDIRSNYQDKKKRWDVTGRYGWRGPSGDVPYALGLTALRTGENDVFDFFNSYTEHIRDVDIIHYREGKEKRLIGLAHRRNKDHWSGEAMAHYTYSSGLALQYFMTGDLRTREVLLKTARVVDNPNMITAYSRCYEATGDKQYLKPISRIIGPYLGNPPKVPYHNFRFASDYFPALDLYLRVNPGDKQAKQTLISQAYWWAQPEMWSYFAHYAYGFYPLSVRALGCKYNGDKETFVNCSKYMLANSLYKGKLEKYDIDDYDLINRKNKFKASLTVGWLLMMYPQYIALMLENGISEQDLTEDFKKLEKNSQPGAVIQPENKQFMPLELTGANYPASKLLREVTNFVSPVKIGIDDLPWGAEWEVGAIPFRFNIPEKGAFVLNSKKLLIPVNKLCSVVFILGNVAANADFISGGLGGTYKINYGDGSSEELPMRNMIDYEDIAALWKFSKKSNFGQYLDPMSYRNPRRHINILKLDTQNKMVKDIELLPGKVKHKLLVLAATALVNTKGEVQEKASKLALDKKTIKGDFKKSGSGIEFSSNIQLTASNLTAESYRVTLEIRAKARRGKYILDIFGQDRKLAKISLGPAFYRFAFIIPQKDGKIELGLYPGARSIGNTWELKMIELAPASTAGKLQGHIDLIKDLRFLPQLSLRAKLFSPDGSWGNYRHRRAELANDGKANTIFSAARKANTSLEIQFRKPLRVNVLRIISGTGETGMHGFDLDDKDVHFKFQGWLNGKWETLKTNTIRLANDDYVYRFPSVESNKFRLLISKTHNVKKLHATQLIRDVHIREIQLYDSTK